MVGKVPKRVLDIDDTSPVVSHKIEACVLEMSFPASVRHDTPLMHFWGNISRFISSLSFSGWVLNELLAFIFLRRSACALGILVKSDQELP